MNGTDEVAGPRRAAASGAGEASAGGVSPESRVSTTVPLGIVSFFRKRPAERPALLLLKVSSADAAESAVELAEALAREGHRIVLCDLSVSSPELHRVLGVPNDEGMTDLFEFGASLRRVTTRVLGGTLFFAPAGLGGFDPERLARHPRWDRLLAGAADAEATLLLYAPSDLPGIRDVARKVGAVAVIGSEADVEVAIAALPEGCPLLDRVPVAAPAPEEPEPAPEPAPADEALADFSPFDTDYARGYESWAGPVAGGDDVEPAGAVQDGVELTDAEDGVELTDAEEDLVEAASSDAALAALARRDAGAIGHQTEPRVEDAEEEPVQPAAAADPATPGEAALAASLAAALPPVAAPPAGPPPDAVPHAPPDAPSPGSVEAPYARPARDAALAVEEAETESPRVRTGFWIGLGVLIALLLVLLWALTPDAGADPSADAPTEAEEAPARSAMPAPPERGEIVPLGYTVAIEAHTDLDTARIRLARLERAEEGVPFLITPFLLDGVVFYRLMAGPYADSAEAVVVRDVLFRDGRKATVGDWDVRPTSFGFLVDEVDDAEAARERTEELFERGIPAYAIPVGPDGATRVYAGAFELREQAPVLAGPLRAAGLDPSLVRIAGWMASP